ncbi:MAG: lipid ABC transporter permease, partial [Cyanobium sp.]
MNRLPRPALLAASGALALLLLVVITRSLQKPVTAPPSSPAPVRPLPEAVSALGTLEPAGD